LISPLNKGLGQLHEAVTIGEAADQRWNLLREDISLPAAVLSQERLIHNASWMQSFIEAYGVKLAPHGKTTMAPALFALQLKTGAWGITLATAQQTRVAYTHGVRRVLMANQLVGKGNMAIVAELLEDEQFEYWCLVDSAGQVEQLREYFDARGKQLHVLLELGVADGRSGVRDEEQLQAVLAALERAQRTVVLDGIEVYEGVLKEESLVREFLSRAAETTRKLAKEGRFARQPALLSGAGSAWYDVVAEVFSGAELRGAVEVILRPGCYLTHDVGAYRLSQERVEGSNPVAQRMRSGLLPALQVWAYVQSRPEDELAIIGLGKRDAAFDAGLPVPALLYRPGDASPTTVPNHWEVTKMMDQHAYLRLATGDDVRVGDMIAFDISHPCLTFDKWRCLTLLDAQYNVVDVIETYF
jgi:D-serine dehydratase